MVKSDKFGISLVPDDFVLNGTYGVNMKIRPIKIGNVRYENLYKLTNIIDASFGLSYDQLTELNNLAKRKKLNIVFYNKSYERIMPGVLREGADFKLNEIISDNSFKSILTYINQTQQVDPPQRPTKIDNLSDQEDEELYDDMLDKLIQEGKLISEQEAELKRKEKAKREAPPPETESHLGTESEREREGYEYDPAFSTHRKIGNPFLSQKFFPQNNNSIVGKDFRFNDKRLAHMGMRADFGVEKKLFKGTHAKKFYTFI